MAVSFILCTQHACSHPHTFAHALTLCVECVFSPVFISFMFFAASAVFHDAVSEFSPLAAFSHSVLLHLYLVLCSLTLVVCIRKLCKGGAENIHSLSLHPSLHVTLPNCPVDRWWVLWENLPLKPLCPPHSFPASSPAS